MQLLTTTIFQKQYFSRACPSQAIHIPAPAQVGLEVYPEPVEGLQFLRLRSSPRGVTAAIPHAVLRFYNARPIVFPAHKYSPDSSGYAQFGVCARVRIEADSGTTATVSEQNGALPKEKTATPVRNGGW